MTDTATEEEQQVDQAAIIREEQERQRRMEQQLSGFTLSAEARERQRIKEAQEAAKRQKQREFDDVFLKTLAKIYGLPPQTGSFNREFVPILMACTVEGMPSPEVMVGKFAGAQELPRIQIAKDHVITQGGRMTPELAMQLAMLAAANPDMQKEGVEIKGATEEDKLMLMAAVQTLKALGLADLKVLNPPQIDNEQKQAQRMQACQQGWQNLNQWAQAPAPGPEPEPAPVQPQQPRGPNAAQTQPPAPQAGPAAARPQPVSGAVPAAAATAAAEAAAAATEPKDQEKAPADNPAAKQASEYDKLNPDQKSALRDLFRALMGMHDASDDEMDQKIGPVWDKQSDESRKGVLNQALELQKARKDAEANAAREPLTPPPAPEAPPAPEFKPAGQRTYKELLPAEKKLLQEHELTEQKDPGKRQLSKQEKDDLAARWDSMNEEDRNALLAAAAVLEADIAAKAEKQRQAAIDKLKKEHEETVERLKQDHQAALDQFDAAVAASDPKAPADAPALKPAEARTFDQLLPAEQALLRAQAEFKKEDPDKEAQTWDDLDEDARKARFSEARGMEPVMGDEVDAQREAAVKILAEAAARTAAEKAAAKAAADEAEAKNPRLTWEQLCKDSPADAEEVRQYVANYWEAKPDGSAHTEEEMRAKWNGIKTRARQEASLKDIKERNKLSSQPTETKDFESLMALEMQVLLIDWIKHKNDPQALPAAWDALSEDQKKTEFERALQENPPLADALNALRSGQKAAAAKPAGQTPDEPPAAPSQQSSEPVAPAEVIQAAPVPKSSEPETPDAQSPGPVAPVQQKPGRTFWQIMSDLKNSAWSAIKPYTPWADKPAPERPRTEPFLDLLPPKREEAPPAPVVKPAAAENETPVVAIEPAPAAVIEDLPPAPGVDVAAKKEFRDLLLQEKRLLLVDTLRRDGSSVSGDLEAEWNSLDKAGKAARFNEAFEKQPQLRDRVIAEQEAGKKPAPVLNLDPPAPAEVVAKTDETPVIAETATPPPVLRAIGERAWGELLDPEKEAVRLGDSGNLNTESDWDGKWDAEMRDTAFAAGVDGNPELAARVEQARRQNGQPAAAAAVIPAVILPPAAAEVTADKPPVVVTAPAVEAEHIDIPEEADESFASALKERGLNREQLVALPPDRIKAVIAEIKEELAKKSAEVRPAETPAVAEPVEEATPVAEHKDDDQKPVVAAEPAVLEPAAPEPITPKFTSSVRNVFKETPDPSIMDQLHKANISDKFYFAFREAIIKDRDVSVNRAHRDGHISMERARVVIEALESEGIVGEDPKTHRRYVLAERDGTLRCTPPGP